jgi:hypothetical protein
MFAVHRWLPFLIASAAMLASGCDPGYGYAPVDSSGTKLQRWSETIDGVQFEMSDFSQLWGSLLRVGLEIDNHSKVDVVVESALVETSDGKAIKAEGPRDREEENSYYFVPSRAVPSGESQEVYPEWDFVHHGGLAHEVMGSRITWVWKVRIGKEEHLLRVKMKQVW